MMKISTIFEQLCHDILSEDITSAAFGADFQTTTTSADTYAPNDSRMPQVLKPRKRKKKKNNIIFRRNLS